MDRSAVAHQQETPAAEDAAADPEQTVLNQGLELIHELDEFTKDRFTELTSWFDEKPDEPEQLAVQAFVLALNGNPDMHVAGAAVYGATVAAGTELRQGGSEFAP